MAVVSVITHYKQTVFRDNNSLHSISYVSFQNIRIEMNGIWYFKKFIINVNFFVNNSYPVTWDSYDPFDKILVRIDRIFEDNDIFAFYVAYGNPGVAGKGVFYAVYEFIYQDVVTDQQCRNHGSGRNFKGLDDKCPDKKGEN